MAQIDDLLEQAEAQDGSSSWVLITKYQRKEFYVDSDRAVNVVGRKIEAIREEVSVQGENHSQYIEFIMDRYYDGIDIAEQTLAIHYEVGDVSDEDAPVNVYKNDTQIKFGWVVENNLTQYATTIEFCIWARGTLADGNTYVLKTLPQKYEIQRGLTIAGGIIEPSTNWYTQFALTMDQKVAQATESADRAVQAASSLDGVVETVTTAKDEVVQKASTVDTQHSEVESWHQESEQFRNEAEQFRNQAEAITGIGLAEEGKPGIVQPDGVTTKVTEDGKLIVIGGGGGGGTPGATDYEDLDNKPKINGVELSGNKTLEELGFEGTTDYQALENKPSIAGIELSGDKSYDELGLASKEAVARNFEAVNQEFEALDTFTQQLDQDISALDAELEQTNQQLQSTTDKVDDVQESIEAGFKKQVQGEDISVNDSVDGKPIEFALFGKANQNTTQGNQLLNYDAFKTVGIVNGTAIFENNGITITATSKDAYTQYNPINITEENLIAVAEGEKITVSWEENSNIGGRVFVFGNGIDVLSQVNNKNVKTVTVTIPSGVTFITTRFGVDNEGESVVYKNIMVNKGATALPYEPYTGGIPSPNPDYPQEIETAGASGSIEVKSCGKNLLNNNATSKTVVNVTFTVNEDKSVTVNGTANGNEAIDIGRDITVLKSGKYIMSGNISNSNVEAILFAYIDGVATMLGRDYGSGFEFELTKETSVFYRVSVANGKTASNVTVYPMLSVEGGEYKPYKETKSLIPTPNGLPGIKVSSGGNYTDENGQQWITDEIRKFADGSGAYIQNIYKRVLKGTETFIKYNYIYYIGGLNIKKGKDIICSHFVPSVIGDTAKVAYDLQVDSSNKQLRFMYSAMETVEDFKAWLQENNVTVFYRLEEPITTPLTPEQITEIEKLHTFSPVTNISNDAECGMNVTYATLQEALMLQEALNGSKANAEEIVNVKEEIVDVRQDLSDTTSRVESIEERAGLGIKETASGEEIHLTDSAEGKAVEFALYGKARQNTTSGNQLLNYDAWKTVGVSNGTSVFENNGVTITATSNGAYTHSSPTYFPADAIIEVSEGETITLSWEESTNASGLIYIFGNGTTDSMVNVQNSDSKKLSYTVPNGVTFVTFRFGVNVAGTTISFKNIMINKGATALPYEPYTNGASPNPQYPQPIEVSGESGSVEVKSCGKNFIDYPDTAVNSNFWLVGDVTTSANVDAKKVFLPKGNYVFSFKSDVSGNNAISLNLYNKLGNKCLGKSSKVVVGYNEIPFEITEEVYSLTSYTNLSGNYSEIQIEKGNQRTPFQPYKETLSTIPTENGLAGIKVTENGNYTDKNGQQWICDEVVKYADGSGKHIQRVGKAVFDGSEDELWTLKETSTNTTRCFIENIVSIKSKSTAMSDKFIFINGNPGASGGNSAIGSVDYYSFAIRDSLTGFTFRIPSTVTSVEELKAFFNTNITTAYYELATPIETPLTAEQLAEISTFYPVTNISNDFDCGMRIDYVGDSIITTNTEIPIVEPKDEEELESGDNIVTLFGKIKKLLKNVGKGVVDVVDNLLSTSTTLPLSANQGRVLDEKISTINERLEELGQSLNDISNLINEQLTEQISNISTRLSTLEQNKKTIIYSDTEPETVEENTIVMVYETEE